MCILYFLPLALYHDLSNGDFFGAIKDLFIVSYTKYWFFRDYLFLFLFAPIINGYLESASLKNRIYIIAILTFMAIWIGSSMGCQFLEGGKNITNFMLLYVVGNTMRVYKDKWQMVSIWKLVTLFLLINSIVLLSWILTYDSKVSTMIWLLSYPYCSPILYINAILVFMIFGKMKINSKAINWVASSVFAVYLIHCHPVVMNSLIKSGAVYILNICNNTPNGVIPLFILYSVIIFFVCILIDKILHPLWQYTGKQFAKIDKIVKERY